MELTLSDAKKYLKPSEYIRLEEYLEIKEDGKFNLTVKEHRELNLLWRKVQRIKQNAEMH